MNRALLVMVAALLAARPGPVSADRPKRVVIMSTDDPTYHRLSAELAALGWTTSRMVVHDPHLDLIGLHAQMTNNKATTAVALLPAAGRGMDAWIVDDVGMVLSQERFNPGTPPEVIALRTVERLRACRLRVAIEKSAPKPPPPIKKPGQHTDPEVPRGTHRHESRPYPGIHGAVQLSGGLALGWAPGGLSPTGQLRLGGSWLPTRWLAADLVLLVPLIPARVSAEKGESDLYLTLMGAAVRWLGGHGSSWIRPSIGVGVGALLVHLRGHAAASGYTSEEDLLACAMPFFEAGLVIRITRHLRLVTSHMVGITLPRLVVAYGGQPVASLDSPMLTGTLGLELEMP